MILMQQPGYFMSCHGKMVGRIHDDPKSLPDILFHREVA